LPASRPCRRRLAVGLLLTQLAVPLMGGKAMAADLDEIKKRGS